MFAQGTRTPTCARAGSRSCKLRNNAMALSGTAPAEDIARGMIRHNKIGRFVQQPRGVTLDHLDRVGAEAAVPGALMRDEERVQALNRTSSGISPPLHWKLVYMGDVVLPSKEVLRRRQWRLAVFLSQRGTGIRARLTNVRPMTEITLVEDPGKPCHVLEVGTMRLARKAIDEVQPRQQFRHTAWANLCPGLVDVRDRTEQH